MYEKAYEILQNSLIDIVSEEQAKLGYQKEAIRLYYPLSTLNHFFNSDCDADAMTEQLAAFPAYTLAQLGAVQISHKGERFCFFLPEKASEYVHNNKAENEFIFELVALLQKEHTTMQNVIDLFKKTDEHCVVKEMNNGEFDLLIFFSDASDKYYYCFKDEGCHIIYHRFLPEDFNDFGFF